MSDMGHSTESDARRAPVNGSPRGTVAWWEHEKAWEAYHRRHSGQSAERIAERGGFGIEELTYQLGHLPTTWEPGAEALRQMEYFGVQPTRVITPAFEQPYPSVPHGSYVPLRLTVTPSILCTDCGTHGFITNGRWSE